MIFLVQPHDSFATSMGFSEVQKYLSEEWIKQYCTKIESLGYQNQKSMPKEDIMTQSMQLNCSVLIGYTLDPKNSEEVRKLIVLLEKSKIQKNTPNKNKSLPLVIPERDFPPEIKSGVEKIISTHLHEHASDQRSHSEDSKNKESKTHDHPVGKEEKHSSPHEDHTDKAHPKDGDSHDKHESSHGHVTITGSQSFVDIDGNPQLSVSEAHGHVEIPFVSPHLGGTIGFHKMSEGHETNPSIGVGIVETSYIYLQPGAQVVIEDGKHPGIELTLGFSPIKSLKASLGMKVVSTNGEHKKEEDHPQESSSHSDEEEDPHSKKSSKHEEKDSSFSGKLPRGLSLVIEKQMGNTTLAAEFEHGAITVIPKTSVSFKNGLEFTLRGIIQYNLKDGDYRALLQIGKVFCNYSGTLEFTVYVISSVARNLFL